MKKINILISEGHSVVREGIKKIITEEKDMRVVASASSGAQTLRLARELLPDVVLVSAHLPDMSGLRVCSGIKTDPANSASVLVFLVSDDMDCVFESVRAGCSGYLPGSVSLREFKGAIRAVAAGEVVMPREITAQLVRALQKTGRCPLTSTETKVLKLISGGFSNKAAARKLSSSPSTVKNHINSILSKLGVRNRSAAVATAVRKGLI